jgi:hypothetical protein
MSAEAKYWDKPTCRSDHLKRADYHRSVLILTRRQIPCNISSFHSIARL